MLNDLIVWETALLADLGYGLDLTSCAVTGETSGLAYVSPRTGRAVTEAGAGIWTSRLLRLPGFLAGGSTAARLAPTLPAPTRLAPTLPAPTRLIGADGLALTGHFLARDAFGTQHRPLPGRGRCYMTALPHWRTNRVQPNRRRLGQRCG